MAREDISREIGEIKVCLTFIREALAGGSKNFEELFNKCNSVESRLSVAEAWMKEHDNNNQIKLNMRLSVAAMIISIAAVALDIIIKG